MQRTRDNNRGTAHEEWKAARQKEIDAENAARAGAQTAAEAADPILSFQKVSDAEAQAALETIRTGYIPDSMLPGVERMNGRVIANENAAIQNFKYFADTTPSFQLWMGYPLLNAAERSDLAPIASNYTALHNLMLVYSAYPDEPAQVAASASAVEEPAQQVLTPSQQAERNYIKRRTDLVVHDPVTGRNFTEFDLEHEVDSKTELRLRRLMEGRIGNERYTEFLNIKDWQAKQQAETAAKAAAEEMQQHREEN
jgi:hypothetical protein